MSFDLKEFQPIFGEVKPELEASSISDGDDNGVSKMDPILFKVFAADPSHLSFHVTDFRSNTWGAVRSVHQLEDMRESMVMNTKKKPAQQRYHVELLDSRTDSALLDKVMAASPNQVVICFYPLLKQIVACLQFPDLVFQFLDISKNNACVVVKTECGPISYVYVGGEAGKLEDSCEKAAQKAVLDLMKKYEVRVEDITSTRKEMYQQCARLYHLKKNEFESIEKKTPKIALDVSQDAYEVFKHVTVDFISVLQLIVRKTGVLSTTVETYEHGPHQYTSWFTLMPPNNINGFECIFSERCHTLFDAKQNLAKKAIHYLMGLYNLEIFDANYGSTNLKFEAILCDLQRESFLTIKERVLGIKEELHPSPLLVKQDCLTPRGPSFKIPSLASAPLPPKKRKFQPTSTDMSVVAASTSKVPLYFSLPSELETVFKRRKFA